MGVFSDLRESRELLVNLTQREVKGKYKRTLFGQLWSLANPIATMLIYTAVFSFILKVEPETGDPSGLHIFALFLMCGLLPWSFFTNVVNGGMGSLTGNENLIKKVSFPRVVLVISSAASWMYTWLLEMAVLVVVIFVIGSIDGAPGISRVLLYVPFALVLMVLLAFFAVGVAMLLSVANVYFRDTQYLVGIVFQVWFYLTPILYPVSLVASREEMAWGVGGVSLLNLYLANPMAEYVEAFRALLYHNRLPELSNVLACVIWAAVAFVVGYRVFQRHEKGLAEAL